jgi:hypothetical protein
MPIDFSALRHSELHGGDLLADDAPTPIGSQKGTGNGAMLMEMAQLENQQKAAQQNEAAAAQQQQQPPSNQQQHHQGAFRRVLRRTRRNSNSQQQPQQQPQPPQQANNTSANTGSIAGRTVSPSGGTGVGEKRRWEAQAVTAAAAAAVASAVEPNGQQQQHQQQVSQEAAAIESMPIAARTRGSLLMGMLGVGSGGGEHKQKL